jgi:hypothetical protein
MIYTGLMGLAKAISAPKDSPSRYTVLLNYIIKTLDVKKKYDII